MTSQTASESVQKAPQNTQLKKGALGVGGITFLVMSAAAPLSLLAGYGPIGILVGGPGAPAGYLLAGAVLAIFAIGYTTMSRRVSVVGTFYAYIQKGFGVRAGRGAAAGALFAYLAVQVGGAGVLGVSAQSTLQAFFGIEVHWTVPAVTSIIVIWAIGRRGIDVGARILGVLLVIESGILLLLAFAVLVQGGGPEGLSLESFAPANVFSPGMAAASVVWFGAFMGIESTALYRAEARNPVKTVPRATFLSIALLAVFYGFVSWALMQAFGTVGAMEAAAEHPEDMMFIAAGTFLGGWADTSLRVLMLVSTVTSGLAFYNSINRYGHSLALEGVIPSRFAKVHPVHRSPKVGNLQTVITLVAVLGFAVAQLDPYAQMTVWLSTPGVIGIVVLLAGTSAAAASYFVFGEGKNAKRRKLIAASSAIASLLFAFVAASIIVNAELMTGVTDATNVVVAVAPFVVILVAAALTGRFGRRNRKPITSSTSPDPVASRTE